MYIKIAELCNVISQSVGSWICIHYLAAICSIGFSTANPV